MTIRERDKTAKKIVAAIMKDLLEETELGLQADNWEDGDDDDKQDAIKRWELIVKRFIPVTTNTVGNDKI